MITKWFTSLLCGVALVSGTLSSIIPASADQAPSGKGPAVARVSILEGSATVQRGDSNEQVAATVNAPLLPGDYFSTGRTSRAELQFDGFTAARLGNGVQARVTSNDSNSRQLQLAEGTVELGLIRQGEGLQIDTPSVSVRGREVGDYRVTVDRDGTTWVTARRGSAEVMTPQRTYTLESGRTLVARGSAERPSITYTSEVAFDSFDDFNAKRDQTMMAAVNASPNLAPSIAGYDNLDSYGNWQDVSGYGQVWVPDEPSGWAPYRDGSWSWEGGYGWTWVGAEPWGWAPYHYGRWFWANGYGWAWYPPAYGYYPDWSPALVGFFGFGVGFDGIGWCPLAPFEPFYAWYPGWYWGGWGWGFRPWGRFGTRIVNIYNIHNIYRNFGRGGGSGTLRGKFGHGKISGHTLALNDRSLGGHVGTIHGALPVTPGRDSERFNGSAAHTPFTLSRNFSQGRLADTRSTHDSFASQQRSVSGATREAGMTHESAPATHENAPAMRENAPAMHESAPAATHSTFVRSDSWQRFDQSRGSESRGSVSASSGAREGSTVREAPGTREGATERESSAGGSWTRYSSSRGSSDEMYTRNPYSGGSSYSRNPYSSGSSYSHNPYSSSSSRNPYGSSYSRNPYGGSYSRNPYSSSYSRGSYPSYSRGSYPSYSRESAPSYSRGSYPSYSRGSAPSYSRGSTPSYSRGSSGSAPHPSGGGGGGGHGGGRPPQ